MYISYRPCFYPRFIVKRKILSPSILVAHNAVILVLDEFKPAWTPQTRATHSVTNRMYIPTVHENTGSTSQYDLHFKCFFSFSISYAGQSMQITRLQSILLSVIYESWIVLKNLSNYSIRKLQRITYRLQIFLI